MPNEQPDYTAAAFLALLARDIVQHPEHLSPLTTEMMEEVQTLIADVKLDLDASLDGDEVSAIC